MARIKRNTVLKSKRRPIGLKFLKWKETDMQHAVQVVSAKEMSERAAARQFKVPKTTLHDRLSGKVKVGSKPGKRPIFNKQQETKLVDYACNRAALGIGFGKQQFMKYTAEYAKKYKIKFKKGSPSDKWWRGLKKRCSILAIRKPEATASIRHQCMDPVKVSKYFKALQDILNDTNTLSQPNLIWNMDETGFQLDHKPLQILARKGSKHLQSRTSGNRELITVIGAINAAGKCLPPHIIPKGKTVRALSSFQTEQAPKGTNWSVSNSGWTKQGIAKLWFTNTFLPNIGDQRPQVLILDGHDSHNFLELIEVAVKNQIHIVELPAHTSHWLQPCDRTVFGPMKRYYNEACQQFMNDYPGVVVSKSNFCTLFSKAWEPSMTESNIKSGFRACGIFPFDPSAISAQAYIQNSLYSVQALLDDNILLDKAFADSKKSNESTENMDQSIGGNAVPLPPVDQQHDDQLTMTRQEVVSEAENELVEQIKQLLPASTTQHHSENDEITPSDKTDSSEDGSSGICPPELALLAIECSLSGKEKQVYERRYENEYDITNDNTYNTWKKYKDILKENTNLSEDIICLKETSEMGYETSINANDSNLDQVINMLDFISNNESDKNDVRERCSPIIAFTALNSSLTEIQKTTFQYCYENKFEISGDDMFSTWKALKDLLRDDREPSKQCTESLGSSNFPDRLNKDATPGEDTGPNYTRREHTQNMDESASPLVNDESTLDNLTDNVMVNSRAIHPTFPFLNTSFPGDEDSDVLPYPNKAVRKKKGVNVKEKYFVLTSKEAYESKRRQVEEKKKRENEKQRRQNKKQLLVQSRNKANRLKCKINVKNATKKFVKQSQLNTPKTINKKQTIPKAKKTQPTTNMENSPKTVDMLEYYCCYCNEQYEEPPKEDWIICHRCQKWCHEQCSNGQPAETHICDFCLS